jgi:hypothetical protein
VPRDSIRQWWSIASSADGTRLVAVVSGGQILFPPTRARRGHPASRRGTGTTWPPPPTARASPRSSRAARSTSPSDSGLTWSPRESSRSWHSVAYSADGTRLLAAVSSGKIYTSTSVPVVNVPTHNTAVTLWEPVVSWGSSSVCQYSYDALVWFSVSCLGTGSDILAPHRGSSPTLISGVLIETGL